jgi:hypothetical protein
MMQSCAVMAYRETNKKDIAPGDVLEDCTTNAMTHRYPRAIVRS